MFEAGWVQLNPQWQQPELAETWVKLRELRTEANKVLEQARSGKDIGSSLEAKLLIHVADSDWKAVLQTLNPATSLSGNAIDELRYLFLVSQVELVDSADRIAGMKYATQTETLSIGVADAEGQKCDRCWNYSTHVGESAEHPLLCERCVEAVDGKF